MSRRLLRADFATGLEWVQVGEGGPWSIADGWLSSTANGANGYGFARSDRGVTPTARYLETVCYGTNNSSDWIMLKLFAESAIWDQNGYGVAVRGSGEVFLFTPGAPQLTYQIPHDIASTGNRIKFALNIPTLTTVEAWVDDVRVLTSPCTSQWRSDGLAEFAGFNSLTGAFDFIEIRDGPPDRQPSITPPRTGVTFSPHIL